MLTAARSGMMPETFARSSSLRAVKEALGRVVAGADPHVEAVDQAHHLDLLAERVRRLNRLGGIFAGVRLSPDVERLRAALEAGRASD